MWANHRSPVTFMWHGHREWIEPRRNRTIMTWLDEALARIRSFFCKSSLDVQLDDEIAEHIDLLTEENVRRGMTQEAARVDEFMRFVSRDAARELHRDTRG